MARPRKTGTRRPPRISSSGSCRTRTAKAPRPSIPAGQPAAQDLQMAIDAMFNHPNVGPVSRQGADPLPGDVEPEPRLRRARGRLLQRQRLRPARQVSGRWPKAILLDPEARNVPERSDLRQAQGAGALHSQHPPGVQRHVGERGRAVRRLHQLARTRATWARRSYRPTTVFSYFPQDYYAPPASAGLLGPEFGIMDASTSLKRANFVNQIVVPAPAASPCSATRTRATRRTAPRST